MAATVSPTQREIVNSLGENVRRWCEQDWPPDLTTWLSVLHTMLANILVEVPAWAKKLDLLVSTDERTRAEDTS